MNKSAFTYKDYLYPSTIVGLFLALIHEIDGYRFNGGILEAINLHYFLHEILGVMDSTPLVLFLAGSIASFVILYFKREII